MMLHDLDMRGTYVEFVARCTCGDWQSSGHGTQDEEIVSWRDHVTLARRNEQHVNDQRRHEHGLILIGPLGTVGDTGVVWVSKCTCGRYDSGKRYTAHDAAVSWLDHVKAKVGLS